jgi:hypothetical protein
MCSFGQWNQYNIFQSLWPSCPIKGADNPGEIWCLDRKWEGWTLRKLYSIICWIFERAKAEGEECSYEDHLSCLNDLQDQACEVLEEQEGPLPYIQRLNWRSLGKFCYKVWIGGLCREQSICAVAPIAEWAWPPPRQHQLCQKQRQW